MAVRRRSKREQEIIEQIQNGTYEADIKKRLRKRNANLRNQKAEAEARKQQEDIAPVKTTAVARGEDAPWYKQILKVPDAFKDDKGNGFTDTLDTIGSTAGDIGLGFVKGITGIGEEYARLGAGGVAQVADWIGQDEYAEKVRGKLAEEAPVRKWLNEQQNKVAGDSVLGETGAGLAQGAGYLAGLYATGAVAGSLAKGATATEKAVNAGKLAGKARDITIFSSSAGSTLQESYQKEDVADWDELEKSIIANLADDVIVGVKGRKANFIIVKKFS
jgi:hypothetical protein